MEDEWNLTENVFMLNYFWAFTSLSKLKQMYYYFSLLLLRGTKFHFSMIKK